MKKVIVIFIFLSSCRPCSVPDLTMPPSFFYQECVEKQMENHPEADLCRWWDQFNDPLLTFFIDQGLSYNHDLLIAREKICESRAILGMDASTLLPQVNATLFFDRLRNSQTLALSPFLGGTYVDFYETGFFSIWEIDLFGKNLDRTLADRFEIAAAKEKLRDVHVSISSEIAAKYFIIRSLQERIKMTQDQIFAQNELLTLVADRFHAGVVSEIEFFHAKSLLEEKKSSLPPLESEFYKTIFALAVLTGQIPENLVNCFWENKNFPHTEVSFPLGLPTELLCRRGDIRQAEFEMRAKGLRVLSARKEFFPTLSLSSLYSYATSFFTSWFKPQSREWTLLPFLSLPLFHGGEILYHVDYQTSLQKQAVLKYEKQVIVALQEVESALVSYFQEKVRLEALTETMQTNEKAYKMALTLYKAGLVDFLYVIDREKEFYLSKISQLESKEKFLTQLVAVYKSLGGGWACCD